MPPNTPTLTPEWKEKIRASSVGKPKSAETRARMTKEVCKYGHVLAETRVTRGALKSTRCYTCAKTRTRKSFLKKKFGITLGDLAEMIAAQGDKCAICSGVNKSGRALAIDHNHKTGKVRGLLCDNCNTSLGKVQDSKETLRAMITYLETRG